MRFAGGKSNPDGTVHTGIKLIPQAVPADPVQPYGRLSSHPTASEDLAEPSTLLVAAGDLLHPPQLTPSHHSCQFPVLGTGCILSPEERYQNTQPAILFFETWISYWCLSQLCLSCVPDCCVNQLFKLDYLAPHYFHSCASTTSSGTAFLDKAEGNQICCS